MRGVAGGGCPHLDDNQPQACLATTMLPGRLTGRYPHLCGPLAACLQSLHLPRSCSASFRSGSTTGRACCSASCANGTTRCGRRSASLATTPVFWACAHVCLHVLTCVLPTALPTRVSTCSRPCRALLALSTRSFMCISGLPRCCGLQIDVLLTLEEYCSGDGVFEADGGHSQRYAPAFAVLLKALYDADVVRGTGARVKGLNRSVDVLVRLTVRSA